LSGGITLNEGEGYPHGLHGGTILEYLVEISEEVTDRGTREFTPLGLENQHLRQHPSPHPCINQCVRATSVAWVDTYGVHGCCMCVHCHL